MNQKEKNQQGLPPNYFYHQLPNGIEMIGQYMPSLSSISFGFQLDAAVIHEPEGQQGLAHLFEYMLLNHGEEPDSLTSGSAERHPRDPRTELESKELREAITRALQELPCRMATVYQLYESEGWSGRAICEALQISQQNLWMMLCRARQRLRESLSSWR